MLEYLQHQRHDNFWMWIWAVRECADGKLHTSFNPFLRDMQPNLILSSPGFTDIMHSFAYLAFDWCIQPSTSILSSPQFVFLSWIFLPQNIFPLPLPLSHHPASFLWPSTPLFLPVSFFLWPPHHHFFFSSPLPSLIPHTKWRVTVCSCGFCPPDSILGKSLAPRTCIQTEGGIGTNLSLSSVAYIIVLRWSYAARLASVMQSRRKSLCNEGDSVSSCHNTHVSLFPPLFIPQKAKLHAALQEKNRLNLELINHHLKASKYDQVRPHTTMLSGQPGHDLWQGQLCFALAVRGYMRQNVS